MPQHPSVPATSATATKRRYTTPKVVELKQRKVDDLGARERVTLSPLLRPDQPQDRVA